MVIGPIVALPITGKVVGITVFKDGLFVATENGVYSLNDGELVQIPFARVEQPRMVSADSEEYAKWAAENIR